MSSVGACDNCCSSTENEPLCLCDGCEQESQLANDAAKEAAHAAGYAAAVADVVAMLEEQMRGLELMPRAKVVLRYVRSLLNRLHTGAHVGAAKKGAT